MDHYTVRPRTDAGGFELSGDMLSDRQVFEDQGDAICYAKSHSGNRGAKIQVLDARGVYIRCEEVPPGGFDY